MPCTTRPTLTELQKQGQARALERLRQAIGAGTVTLVVSRQGAIALRGWVDAERNDVTDLCAYRKLQNTPEMRRAQAKAEALAGVKVNPRTIAAGVHSHDGGHSWGHH